MYPVHAQNHGALQLGKHVQYGKDSFLLHGIKPLALTPYAPIGASPFEVKSPCTEKQATIQRLGNVCADSLVDSYIRYNSANRFKICKKKELIWVSMLKQNESVESSYL